MKSKEELEATSNLIRACGLIGAIYRKDHIRLSDGNTIQLKDHDWAWKMNTVECVHKESTVKDLVIFLLELHLKILKEKA